MEQIDDDYSNIDFHSNSFDTIYPTNSSIDSLKIVNPYLNKNCYERCCIWWFFHTSHGLHKYNDDPNDESCKCICCNLCSWCCEFRFNQKCCITEWECCCFSLEFQ